MEVNISWNKNVLSLNFLSYVVVDLQSVEEAECRKAYDSAAEIYVSSFDRTKPPEEVSYSS